MPPKKQKVTELHEEIAEEIRKEVEDSGKNIDEIMEDVDDIKEEVLDSAKDVDDIKEDVVGIKMIIDAIQQKQDSILKKISTKLHISKFNASDIAQQIVGAMILSVPFAVTQEVWDLSQELDQTRLILIIFLTLLFDVLLIYFTKFQNVQTSDLKLVLARLVSLIFISYFTAGIILYLFGVIGTHVVHTEGIIKLVVLTGLFANIGASTADVLK